MTNKTTNDYILIYKSLLKNGEIQITYKLLLKYMMELKTDCEKTFVDQYSFGNLSPGYMDFSYFPFFNEFLRNEKLRFGIVLNHQKMRFELWLMGQNAQIQKKYWNLLKDTKWNKGVLTMPQYSILECVLCEKPDFNNSVQINIEIKKKLILISEELIIYIKKLCK
ncbi:DUF7000 family protein [Desulfovibrio litoralis]|uniref:DUF7000 domain-containing protein n=1 Tax=Desulfovibrio litoralis DSM 11393 TaxID=1121455 RepID=A0A1M7RVJ5_9BACT|nr:hypothetical protein [Desulfovibrio litoralis]SHN50166.1 hypothetical protein SAMN02745728_00211 [Desulfovibrio litoralis DSM 11393]